MPGFCRERQPGSTSRLASCIASWWVIICGLTTALPRSQGGDKIGEESRILVEAVHEAISELVELIKTFQNQNKLLRLLTSTLFKKRQAELNAAVDRAIAQFQVGNVRSWRSKGAGIVLEPVRRLNDWVILSNLVCHKRVFQHANPP